MSNQKVFHEFLSVKIEDYDQCIDVLEHNFELCGIEGKIRFHHLKFDGNGRPMVKALAGMLYDYIIMYCIASKNRNEPLTPQQSARLTKEARNLFRRPNLNEGEEDKTGEAGETLLFFLTEAILGAPQLVAKMEMKTNHNDEVKGSDGIHGVWNEKDNLIDFYFGESKLYQNVHSAISSALTSISDFHDKEMYKHELLIATKHFKYSAPEVKEKLANLIIGGEPGPGARLNHACLIGYDWNKYQKTVPRELKQKIKEILLADGENIVNGLNKKLSDFEKKHLRFEIFFLPFPSVAEFRKEFNLALS